VPWITTPPRDPLLNYYIFYSYRPRTKKNAFKLVLNYFFLLHFFLPFLGHLSNSSGALVELSGLENVGASTYHRSMSLHCPLQEQLWLLALTGSEYERFRAERYSEGPSLIWTVCEPRMCCCLERTISCRLFACPRYTADYDISFVALYRWICNDVWSRELTYRIGTKPLCSHCCRSVSVQLPGGTSRAALSSHSKMQHFKHGCNACNISTVRPIRLRGKRLIGCLYVYTVTQNAVGLIPDEVIGYLQVIWSFQLHCGSVVDSASNKNYYQEYFW
jgi:hypothetical protein